MNLFDIRLAIRQHIHSLIRSPLMFRQSRASFIMDSKEWKPEASRFWYGTDPDFLLPGWKVPTYTPAGDTISYIQPGLYNRLSY